MYKILQTIAFGVLLCNSAFAQDSGNAVKPVSSDDARTVFRPMPDDEVVRELAAQPLEVWQAYGKFSALPASERKSAFTSLSASMKTAIWRHHALQLVAEHPEFTHDQKAVITDFLSLLTTELYDIPNSSPLWIDRFDTRLRELRARAVRVFDPQLVHTIFINLGDRSGSVATSIGSTAPRFGKARPVLTAASLADCECSTISDWCASPPLGAADYKCVGGGCFWSSAGCGTALAYACTGLCIKQNYGDPGGG